MRQAADPSGATEPSSPRKADATPSAAEYIYKAFVSYSHSADEKLAPALQTGLHRFAKPWYKLRAMRVFRDETTLPTSHVLWPPIEAALDKSEFFVFLASPGAAESYWVRKEFEHWVTHRERNRMLIVLTEGEILWDRDKGDFDWARTTALPRGIEHGFHDEPLYLDLRWARNGGHLSLRNPSFRSAIADLASTLLGRPKDALIGEDLRRHRQTRRVAWSAVAALLVLTGVSIVAAFLAVRNQRLAEDRLYLTESRQLAAVARTELEAGQLDLGLLLGLESFRPLEAVRAKAPGQSFDARSMLLRALTTNPRLDAYIRPEEGSFGYARFSPDGKLIAVATSRRITFWDAQTHQPTGASIEGPGDAVFKIAFSLDGAVLAVGSRGANRLMLLDVAQRRLLHPPLTAQDGAISGLAFSPDGELLASGAGDHSIVLWNVASGTPEGNPLEGHESNVVALAFSPDGRRLASASWDAKAIVWDLATRSPAIPPLEHRGQVEDLAFSPDGRLLATASRNLVTFWNPETGEKEGRQIQHRGKVNVLAFSPDMRLLAVAGSGTEEITLWSVPDEAAFGPALTGHGSWIESLSFSPDGRMLLSGSVDGSVVVWRPDRSQRLAQVVGPSGSRVESLALSGDDAMLAVGGCGSVQGGACKQGEIRLWRIEQGDAEAPPSLHPLGEPLTGHTGAVQTIDFGPGPGELMSAGCARFEGSRCMGAEIRRWDAQGRATVESAPALLDGLNIGVMGLDAAAGVLATSVGSREVWLTATQSGEPVGDPLTGLRNLPLSIGFGAGARRVAVAALNGESVVWDTATGLQVLETVVGSRLALDPGGGIIATFDRESVVSPLTKLMLWDGESGALLRESVTPLDALPTAVALAPQHRMLAFADSTNGLLLWDLDANRLLGVPLAGHDDSVGELAFLNEAPTLVSADHSGTVMLWDLGEESWRRKACQIANRNLSYAEWQQHVGEEPYELTCPEFGVPRSLADAGRERAAAGDLDGAVSLLARARELGDSTVRDPAGEVAELVTAGLLEKARTLGELGNVAGAEAALTEAAAIAPSAVTDAGLEARALAAPFLNARTERLARLERVGQALAAFEVARGYGVSEQMTASAWNALCLSGALNARVDDTLFACSRAVENAGRSQNFYDSRGVARTLIGDIAGAIEDFESFVTLERQPNRRAGRPGSVQERAQLTYIARVEGWTDELRAQNMPFSAEELQDFRRLRFMRN